eukprot:gb/GECG01002513.1/.p1 GENE.gb/GECG01002513.1/~~gb/GECG01002513.1/.p1  ORF type:complete len:309 (+),score=52.03 gb/GECG01002513.1/:1-927(+)
MALADTLRSNFISAAADASKVLTNIRNKLFFKGSHSTLFLRRALAAADVYNEGALDREDFEEALQFAGVFISTQETGALLRQFPADDNDEKIDYNEFLRNLSMTLNPRREKFVRKVFNTIKSENGEDPTPQQLSDRMNAENHPDVAAGQTTPEKIRQELVDDLSSINGGDNTVTEEDFLQLYSDAGATMPSDDFFVTVLEREWNISEEALARNDQEKIRRYIDTMLERARQKSRPGEPQQLYLENACKYFDIEEEGCISFENFRNVLSRLGVPLSREDALLTFNHFPRDEDGKLVYKDFVLQCFQERG